eukprot:SAG11_NODE_26304_length_347_cov_0.580645_1_plen_25_part_10
MIVTNMLELLAAATTISALSATSSP